MAGVAVLVERLRARREEMIGAIHAYVREDVPAPGLARVSEPEYSRGLYAAVAAAVDFGLAGIELGERCALPVPTQAVTQAQRAARSGVALDMVLRRYMLGSARLWEYVLEEGARSVVASDLRALREIARRQTGQLDRLVIAVAREHASLQSGVRASREQRLAELVDRLLDGEALDAHELDYDLHGQHTAAIAHGARAETLVRAAAEELQRRLLCLERADGALWVWLGGPLPLDPDELDRALDGAATRAGIGREEVSVAAGEPGQGLEGWRLTHRQASSARSVSQCKPRPFTRYRDVALLAAALADSTLARSLTEIYLQPLRGAPGEGSTLRQTLRAYLAAGRNTTSTAALLGVARSTVESRLRTIEERLGRSLHPCPAELEVALHLDEHIGPGLYGARDLHL